MKLRLGGIRGNSQRGKKKQKKPLNISKSKAAPGMWNHSSDPPLLPSTSLLSQERLYPAGFAGVTGMDKAFLWHRNITETSQLMELHHPHPLPREIFPRKGTLSQNIRKQKCFSCSETEQLPGKVNPCRQPGPNPC